MYTSYILPGKMYGKLKVPFFAMAKNIFLLVLLLSFYPYFDFKNKKV